MSFTFSLSLSFIRFIHKPSIFPSFFPHARSHLFSYRTQSSSSSQGRKSSSSRFSPGKNIFCFPFSAPFLCQKSPGKIYNVALSEEEEEDSGARLQRRGDLPVLASSLVLPVYEISGGGNGGRAYWWLLRQPMDERRKWRGEEAVTLCWEIIFSGQVQFARYVFYLKFMMGRRLTFFVFSDYF